MTFRDKLRAIIKVKDTPHRIALSFALGVFMGNSPFLGLHYIGGIFLAWLFRMNKLVAFAGVSVNNPWTIVPISTLSVWIGAKLLAIQEVLPEVDWNAVTFTTVLSWMQNLITDHNNFLNLITDLMPLIKSFFVGSLIFCTMTSIASYFIIKPIAARYKRRNAA